MLETYQNMLIQKYSLLFIALQRHVWSSLIPSSLRVVPTLILWQILCLFGFKKNYYPDRGNGALMQTKNATVFPFLSASALQLSPFWRVNIES